MSLIGIRSLIFAIQEVNLFNQSDLKDIKGNNQDDDVQNFRYFSSAFILNIFGSPLGTVTNDINCLN